MAGCYIITWQELRFSYMFWAPAKAQVLSVCAIIVGVLPPDSTLFTPLVSYWVCGMRWVLKTSGFQVIFVGCWDKRSAFRNWDRNCSWDVLFKLIFNITQMFVATRHSCGSANNFAHFSNSSINILRQKYRCSIYHTAKKFTNLSFTRQLCFLPKPPNKLNRIRNDVIDMTVAAD